MFARSNTDSGWLRFAGELAVLIAAGLLLVVVSTGRARGADDARGTRTFEDSGSASVQLAPSGDAGLSLDAGELANPRFEAWDVLIDSGPEGLAAYQVELKAAGESAANVQIVGVEGGEAGRPYGAAPFYDPRAMQQNVVILGALSEDAGAGAPAGVTRVARVHVMIEHDAPTQWSVRVVTAGKKDGSKIEVTAKVEKAGG